MCAKANYIEDVHLWRGRSLTAVRHNVHRLSVHHKLISLVHPQQKILAALMKKNEESCLEFSSHKPREFQTVVACCATYSTINKAESGGRLVEERR